MNSTARPIRVFLTGASGAVGRHVLSHCLAQGDFVRVLLHKRGALPPASECVAGDLAHFDESWIADVDVVIHLAALLTAGSEGAGAMREVNVQGTRRVVEAAAARGVRVVYASTMAVFEPSVGVALDSASACRPMTLYGRTKLEGEKIVASYGRGVVIRLPLVVGEGDRASPKFRRMVRLGVFPVTARHFSAMSAEDAARLFRHVAAEPETDGACYTVSDGADYTWRSMARHFARVAGRRILTPPMPRVLMRPWIMRLLGNEDAGYYLRYDWRIRPNFPAGFAPRTRAFPLAFE